MEGGGGGAVPIFFVLLTKKKRQVRGAAQGCGERPKPTSQSIVSHILKKGNSFCGINNFDSQFF
jgi:hypothetical protein